MLLYESFIALYVVTAVMLLCDIGSEDYFLCIKLWSRICLYVVTLWCVLAASIKCTLKSTSFACFFRISLRRPNSPASEDTRSLFACALV
ncbi:hypothetical protein ACFX2J_039893 [Malus domestica]